MRRSELNAIWCKNARNSFTKIKRLRVTLFYGDIKSGLWCHKNPVLIATERAVEGRVPWGVYGYTICFRGLFRSLSGVAIDTESISIWFNGMIKHFDLPEKVAEFISAYDKEEVSSVMNDHHQIFDTYTSWMMREIRSGK